MNDINKRDCKTVIILKNPTGPQKVNIKLN